MRPRRTTTAGRGPISGLESLEGRVLLAATPYLVTSPSGDPTVVGSLPYEVGLANTQTPNPDGSDITFDPTDFPTATTITLTTTTLALSQPEGPEVIDGTGVTVTVSAGDAFGVMSVNSGTTAVINALTISNGSATQGGGIYNQGTLTITDSTLTDNTAGKGGAIYNDGGTVTISDSCVITSNRATSSSGGGIYENGGTVTITGSNLANNHATYGGGVYVKSGSLTITGGTLEDNHAEEGGASLIIAAAPSPSAAVAVSPATVPAAAAASTKAAARSRSQAARSRTTAALSAGRLRCFRLIDDLWEHAQRQLGRVWRRHRQSRHAYDHRRHPQ